MKLNRSYADLGDSKQKEVVYLHRRSTEQFGSVSQATSFLRYYSKFSALQPKAIESPDYLPMADEVERRLALMLGIAPSTRSSRRAYDTTTPKVKKHDGLCFHDTCSTVSCSHIRILETSLLHQRCHVEALLYSCLHRLQHMHVYIGGLNIKELGFWWYLIFRVNVHPLDRYQQHSQETHRNVGDVGQVSSHDCGADGDDRFC